MTESTVTLEEALKLLSLPRTLGVHPDDNEPIVTNFGRFGPYVKHGDEFRSLESDDDVFAISFDAALALIRAPKQSRRRQAAKTVLKELTKDGLTIKLLSGRYGPYVTDGSLNASLPKTMNPEAITYEQAAELLAARKDAAPRPRRGGFKRRAVKSAAPRARARKAAGA
jgi:DNA topoisomerase I